MRPAAHFQPLQYALLDIKNIGRTNPEMAKSAVSGCRQHGLHQPSLLYPVRHQVCLSHLAASARRPDGIRRHFRPSSSVPGCGRTHTCIPIDHGPGRWVCPVRLFPSRPRIQAVSESENDRPAVQPGGVLDRLAAFRWPSRATVVSIAPRNAPAHWRLKGPLLC